MYAPTKTETETVMGGFVAEFEAQYLKATACLVEDQDVLLTFFSYPAEHWTDLRTTNPTESPFPTVPLRRRLPRGPGSRPKGLLMALQLLQLALPRPRRLNGPTCHPWCAPASGSSQAPCSKTIR